MLSKVVLLFVSTTGYGVFFCKNKNCGALHLFFELMNFPKELEDIKDYLIDYDFRLSQKATDWRVNSAINEWEIMSIIKNRFEIVNPRDRERYDFWLQINENFIPVNIKVTETTNADNLNCKLWIYYALTWILPDFKNEIPREKFFVKLKENLEDTNKDYYFLIVNKANLSDIFITSLKWLTTLVPNWNNLPFQCKWDDNRTFIKRTFEQSKSFILTKFWDSIKKRANIFLVFKELFNEYVN